MKVAYDALNKAQEMIDRYDESKGNYDAGNKKDGYWRILSKDLPMAQEIIRLSRLPEPEPVVLTRTEYRIPWAILGVAVIFSLVMGFGLSYYL